VKIALSMSASQREPWRDFIWQTYVPFFQFLGFTPVLVPNVVQDVSGYVTAVGIEGLVLTGGGDIDPARYGQPDTHSKAIAPRRDTTEWALLEHAVTQRMPVFAICRGMQMLNVFFGGALVQDIPTQIGTRINHDDGEHTVTLTDPALAGRLGCDHLAVNTHHHQAVIASTQADALAVFAVSEPDGVVEGLWHSTLPVLGVQWHPERPTPSRDADALLIRAALSGALWV
jgi:putative glutamine amidotransferase